MIIKDLLKDWRILLVIICVVFAILMIFPRPTAGVMVKSIDTESQLVGKLKVGDVLSWANEVDIRTPEDLLQFENFTGTFRFIDNGGLVLAELSKPGLGITVSKIPSSKLSFGMDLIGGTRVLLKPIGNVSEELLDQTITGLENRINTYGLREAKFQKVNDATSGITYVQIEMAGGSREEIDSLLAQQGRFEAKIPKAVTLTGGGGTLRIGNSSFDVAASNNTVDVGGITASQNSTFNLGNIEWQVRNITTSTIVFVASVFDSADIKTVCIVEQPGICHVSDTQVSTNYWQFEFGIYVSDAGAQRFADVTKGMKPIVDQNTGESHLESKIEFYLDGKPISALDISSDLAGKAETSVSITGVRESKDAARTERRILQSVLSSGTLPVQLSVVRVDAISASLGAEFVRAAMLAVLIASASVMCVIYARYRRIKILIPMMIWSASETILILGVASIINWTIDLASIAGLVAAIGTGTNDQIMIIDEILLGRKEKSLYTVRQRVKRAFFIVFGAAGTIIAAMLPLLFVGIGVMRGFAITTTLGVLIGVFITRPAFGRVAEKILGKEEA